MPLITFNSVHADYASRMFEKFRKKDEDSGGEMVQERQYESEIESPQVETQKPPLREEQRAQESMSSESNIGIGSLMNKRAKLEEAIDYVGLMIKQLKDKRTNLEKDIEEESVDIKNLKEKLVKVREYIDEERQGIQTLTKKRSDVEREADEVGNIINDLRNKLAGVDKIVEDEGNRIKSIKQSRQNSENI